jgi:hypothetical protein
VDRATQALLTTSSEKIVASKPGGLGWTDLSEIGWLELASDAPAVATQTLLETLGRHGVPSCAVDACIVTALRRANISLPDSGISYLHPRPGAQDVNASQEEMPTPNEQVRLTGVLLWLEPGPEPLIIAPLHSESGPTLVLTRMENAAFPESGQAGAETSPGWVVIENRPATVLAVLGSEAALQARRTGRQALGHEMLGLATEMLDVAVKHVSYRYQFGRPIGSFQAVKHRLADVSIAIEAARAALDETWLVCPEADLTATVAKALCGLAVEATIRHCLQVTGGMGFTEEFPLGLLARRALVLEPILGSHHELATAIGHELIARGDVPRLSSFTSV